MTSVGYAYPWDFVGDPDAATRAAGLGLDAVAVAATYHGARTSSPLHPTRRLFDAPHSASYVPVRDDAWRDTRLRPREATWMASRDSFGDAQRQLHEVGVSVRAWAPLTHVDVTDARDHELCVTNAFGDVLTYALCPANEDVRHYARTLALEVARATTSHDVVIEALGPSGLEHGSVHEKTDFAHWLGATQALLSLCFCAGCRRTMDSVGLDVAALRAAVRAGVDAGESVERALGADVADQLAAVRLATNAYLLRDVVSDLRDEFLDGSITLHASGTAWTTGSFTWIDTATATEGLSLVAYGWEATTALEEVRALARAARVTSSVGVYLRLDRGWSDPEVAAAAIAAYVDAGAREVHLYHLGLLNARGLADLGRVVQLAHAALP